MTIERRLRHISDRLPAQSQPAHYPCLHVLTDAEIQEFRSLSAKAIRQGGLETLNREEIKRGAYLASKASGEPDQEPRPLPHGWKVMA